MLTFVVIIHVFVSLLLIAVVLLQPGNKGGVSAALGGAGGSTVFGGRCQYLLSQIDCRMCSGVHGDQLCNGLFFNQRWFRI